MLYHNNNSKMDGLHVHGLSLSDDDNNDSTGKKIETLKLHIVLDQS
jgi:hypothetical protein